MKFFESVDTKDFDKLSPSQMLERVYDTAGVSQFNLGSHAARKRQAANALADYMKAGIKVANQQNGYSQLGLHKMTNANLTVKVLGRFSSGNKLDVDLTDPASIQRMALQGSFFGLAKPNAVVDNK